MKNFLLTLAVVFTATLLSAQYSDCSTAMTNAAYDTGTNTCGNGPHTFLMSTETASGFFDATSYIPSCDPGSVNTVDLWFKINAFNENLAINMNSVSSGHNIMIFDAATIDCATPSNTPSPAIACFTKNQVGADYFTTCGQPLVLGNDYYVVITMPVGGQEDISNLCFTVPLLDNEDPCAANVLTSGTAEVGTTICADQEVNVNTCTNDENQVWYTYTTPATGTNGFTITMTDISSGGDIAVAVYTMTDCNTLAGLTEIGTASCDGVAFSYSINCTLDNQEYYISVSTLMAEEGDFSIQVDDILDTSCNTNDDCANAIDLNTVDALFDATLFCEWQTLATYCNLDACPESDPITPCQFENNPTVWFEITAPIGATAFNIEIVGSTLADPTVGVFNSNACAGGYSEAAAGSGCNAGGVLNDISITAGNTYYILVGTAGSTGGDFEIKVKFDMAPDNDDCATYIETLTDGTTLATETTICATQDVTSNTICNLTDYEQSVWYTFTTGANTFKASINVVAGTAAGVAVLLLDNNCAAPTVFESACAFGDNEWCVLPSTTYNILVTSSKANEGTFDITYTDITTLGTNDECSGATSLTLGTSLAGETNDCATDMNDFAVPTCPNADDEANVWYEFNTGASDQKIRITVTNVSLGGNTTMIVFDDCTGANEIYSTCSAEGENEFCAQANKNYKIQIGTSDANTGNFDILVENIDETVDLNDICTNAKQINGGVAITSDCDPITYQGSNVDACSESFTEGACNFDMAEAVWYEFTTDADAKFADITFENATVPVTVTLYNNDCTTPTAISGCETAAPFIEDAVVAPNTTYHILVGTTGAGGTYDLLVTVKNPPENDDCASGAYVAHILTDANTLVTETTKCASDDIKPACSGALDINTVWYEYTVPANVKDVKIDITNWTSTNNVHIVAVDACNSTTYYDNNTMYEYCGVAGTELLTIECPVEADVIYFAVGSEQGADGDFDITLNETPKDATCTANDECVDADDLTAIIDATLFCDWQPFNGYCNTTACPEDFTFGSACDYSQNPYVWFKVTIPADVTLMDIRIPNSAFADISFGVFDDFNCMVAPTAAAAGSDCVTTPAGNPEINDIAVTAGNTYYIAIGSTTGGEGNFNFDIKFTKAPKNDDPCNVTPGDIPMLAAGTLVDQTNLCATDDLLTGNCDPNQESSVWYYYTIPAGENGFKLTVTGTGPNPISSGADLSMVIVENSGCAAATFEAEECTSEGVEESFPCLMEGTTYAIMIATSAANEGGFEIELVALPEDVNCIDNDACADADAAPFVGIMTDDPAGETCVTDCNKDACPEGFTFGACDFNLEEVVWYSVTTDATPDASMNVNVTSTDFNPVLAIVEAPCNATPTAASADSGCLLGDGTTAFINNMEVMPNTTYLILVAPSTGLEGGAFTLCVEITTSCNDDPCSPVALTGGSTYNDPDNDCTTTIGSSEESYVYDDGNCPNAGMLQESSVYFSYQAIPNLASFEVAVSTGGTTPISGTVGVTIVEYDAANCDQQMTTIVGQECDDINSIMNTVVECPIAGNVYLIQIATASVDVGDFSIEVIENISSVVNDDCQSAEVLNISDFCEYFEFPGDNTDACPEEFTHPTCTYEDGHFVWYEITIPADVDNMDIQVEGGAALNDPVFAVLTTPCGTLPATAVPMGDCVTLSGAVAELENIVVNPGDTYWIVVGSENDNEGTFTLKVKLDKPPVNDDPCMAENLTGGGSAAMNTTECAGPDYNDQCGNTALTNTVWFTFAAPLGADGLEITINNISTTGNVVTQVYVANPDGCMASDLGMDESNFDCDPLVTERKYKLSCWEDGDVFYIKVATTDEGAGEFELLVEEKTKSCDYADECMDITTQILSPATPPDEDTPPSPDCISSCLDFACPEDFSVGGCDFSGSEVVWFQVDTDGNAAKMHIQITSNGWTPAVTVFAGTDCTDLAVLEGCESGIPGSVALSGVGVNGTTSYWIAVAFDGGSLDDPSFELCVTTTVDYAECSLDQEITVTSRSNDPDGSMGLPLIGPFCPGETVSFCYDLNFDPSETQCQWFQGIVPKFGGAWDKATFTGTTDMPTPGTGWAWYADMQVNYNEPNPFLCTYTNPDGELDLCHPTYEAGCPCSAGIPAGTPLPAGWFYYSPGGGGCANTGHPNTGWGFPQGCNAVTHFQVCFDIDVKVYDTDQECIDDGGDLSVSFYPFADGETGCWGDTKCAGDIPQLKFHTIICDGLVEVEADTLWEICTGETTDILVTASDPNVGIQWIVINEDNNVGGDSDGSVTSSVTSIQQTLTNDTDVPQEVIYQVQAVVPDATCPGPKILIKVIVYPELEIEFDEPYETCADATLPVEVCADAMGGSGNYVNYHWETSTGVLVQDGPNNCISVMPLVTTTYCVTVTDDLGCMGDECVEVVVGPTMIIILDPLDLEICQSEGGEVTITSTITGGTPDYTYTWTPGGGLVGSANFDGNQFIIDVTNSVNSGVPLQLTLDVVDNAGCTGMTTTTISLLDSPLPVVDIVSAPCAGESGDVVLNITSISGLNGAGVNLITVYDCDGIQIEQIFSNQALNLTLPASSCYTIKVEDSNGCSSELLVDISLNSVVDPILSGLTEFCFGDGSYTITIDNAVDYDSYEWSTSDTTSTVTITPATANTYTYTVTVTKDGCTSIGSHTIDVYDAPIIDLSGSTSFCIGSTTTIDVGGDPATWTYTWTDPSGAPVVGTGSSLTISMGGDYNVTVTDDHGCMNSMTIPIVESTELTPVIPQVNICDSDTVTIDAGPGFTTYEWTQQGDPTVLGTDQLLEIYGVGTYCVSVQDASGCSGDTCMTVIQNMTPTVSLDTAIVYNSTDQASCYTVLDFNTFVNGDAGVFTNCDLNSIDISNVSNVDFIGKLKGQYKFCYTTTTAVAPCENIVDTLIVIVRDCVCPSVDLLTPDDLCNSGSSLDLNTVKNTIEPGTWAVITGPATQDLSGIIQNGDSFVSTNLIAGAYTIEFTLTNIVAGCPESNTVIVNVLDKPFIMVEDTIPSCDQSGQAIPVAHNLNDYVSGDAGDWSVVQNPGAVDVTDYTNIDFTGLNTGTYIFKYCTNTAVSPCEDICENLYILVQDCSCPPTSVVDQVVCNDMGSIVLGDYLTTAITAGSWKFKSGPTTVDVSDGIFEHGGIEAGDYVVFYKYDDDIQGCDTKFDMNITVGDQPTATFNPVMPVCGNKPNGTEETKVYLNNVLVLGSDMTGTWTDTDGTGVVIGSDNILDFDGILNSTQLNQSYTFTYSLDAVAPCSPISYEIEVFVKDCACNPLFIEQFDDLCNVGGSVDLDDKVGTLTSKTGVWEISPAIPIGADGVIDVTGVAAGIYTVTYTINDQLPGCPTAISETFEIFAPSWAGVGGSESTCFASGDSYNLFDLLTDNPDVGGNWTSTVTTGFNATLGTFNTSGIGAGEYSFNYAFPGNGECTGSDVNVTITINEGPIADAGADKSTDCDNPTVTLDGSGSTSNLSYQWHNESGPITGETTMSYQALSAGTYTLVVTNVATGCTASDDVVVTASDDVPIFALEGTDPNCFGESNGTVSVIGVTGGDGTYTYQLNTDAFGTVDSWANLPSGSYSITVKDGKGCKATVPITLINPPLVTVSILEEGHLVDKGTEEWIHLSNPESHIGQTITWTKNDSVICSSISVGACDSIFSDGARTTTYCVKAEDENGCSATDCIQVRTQRVYKNYVPTVFDPSSGDGGISTFYMSDDLGIKNIIKFSVYSRWGELVFSVENIKPNDPTVGWNGKFKGKYVDPAVYVYVIDVIFDDDTEETFTGDVTVIK